MNEVDKVALFDSWAEAETELEAAQAKVNQRLESIFTHCGKGPFRYNGVEFRIRSGRKGEGLAVAKLGKHTEEIA